MEGSLTLKQVTSYTKMMKYFKAKDANKDGKLEDKEMGKVKLDGKNAKQLIKIFDRPNYIGEKDGKISPFELMNLLRSVDNIKGRVRIPLFVDDDIKAERSANWDMGRTFQKGDNVYTKKPASGLRGVFTERVKFQTTELLLYLSDKWMSIGSARKFVALVPQLVKKEDYKNLSRVLARLSMRVKRTGEYKKDTNNEEDQVFSYLKSEEVGEVIKKAASEASQKVVKDCDLSRHVPDSVYPAESIRFLAILLEDAIYLSDEITYEMLAAKRRITRDQKDDNFYMAHPHPKIASLTMDDLKFYPGKALRKISNELDNLSKNFNAEKLNELDKLIDYISLRYPEKTIFIFSRLFSLLGRKELYQRSRTESTDPVAWTNRYFNPRVLERFSSLAGDGYISNGELLAFKGYQGKKLIEVLKFLRNFSFDEEFKEKMDKGELSDLHDNPKANDWMRAGGHKALGMLRSLGIEKKSTRIDLDSLMKRVGEELD